MLGIAGIFLALVLLMVLAYRGFGVLLLMVAVIGPIAALVMVVVLGTWLGSF